MVPSRHRMRRSVDYATAVRHGRRAARSTLVVHLVITDSDDPAKVGFVVSRAVGNAVVRNTARRRLRHVVRDHLGEPPRGSLLVVRALPSASTASSADLARDLGSALAAAIARPRHVAAESVR